jgi:hypothetical protein
MIDIETEVFAYVAERLRSQYTNIYVASVKKRFPSSFPAVQIVEMSNTVATDTSDSGSNENHADLMYEVNVYSNLTSGAKKQAKEIMSFVDDKFNELGFVRQLCEPIDNGDTSIYRYVARYVGRASRDKIIYQR